MGLFTLETLNAAVIGVPHAQRAEVIKACVVLTPGTAPSEALREQIQEPCARACPYQYPREIESWKHCR
jgi:acetyl-CoA synthetase